MAKRADPGLFSAAPLPVAELDDRQRLACLRLIRSENVGPVTFRSLINHYGGAEEALAALPELARRGGRSRSIRICSEDAAMAELEAAQHAGARTVFTIEPSFPQLLVELTAPPPMIYVKGDATLLNRRTIAIVGSRQASAAGIEITRQLARDLGEKGLVIVSGLARGIDYTAHRATLSTGTVAVLAGGVDVCYPPEHAGLFAEIGERGCLVSEMPPGFSPRGTDFPRRNRIIAGIVLGVVVVEAAVRSGSLITARLAAEAGREVMVVPGHPLDPRAEGTINLLKSGATPITTAADVLEAISGMIGERPRFQSGSFEAPPPPEIVPHASDQEATVPPSAPSGQGDVTDVAAIVLASLGSAPVSIDGLIRATGISPA